MALPALVSDRYNWPPAFLVCPSPGVVLKLRRGVFCAVGDTFKVYRLCKISA